MTAKSLANKIMTNLFKIRQILAVELFRPFSRFEIYWFFYIFFRIPVVKRQILNIKFYLNNDKIDNHRQIITRYQLESADLNLTVFI